MMVRPYHVWILLGAALVVSGWRSVSWFRRELHPAWESRTRWAALTQSTTEELDRELAYRYRDLARDLGGERDVGYVSEHDRSTLWSDSSPEGAARIKRYYMAQGILAPSILRLDERRGLVVVDCRTAEQAERVVSWMGLTIVRDYGEGLILAKAGE